MLSFSAKFKRDTVVIGRGLMKWSQDNDWLEKSWASLNFVQGWLFLPGGESILKIPKGFENKSKLTWALKSRITKTFRKNNESSRREDWRGTAEGKTGNIFENQHCEAAELRKMSILIHVDWLTDWLTNFGSGIISQSGISHRIIVLTGAKWKKRHFDAFSTASSNYNLISPEWLLEV